MVSRLNEEFMLNEPLGHIWCILVPQPDQAQTAIKDKRQNKINILFPPVQNSKFMCFSIVICDLIFHPDDLAIRLLPYTYFGRNNFSNSDPKNRKGSI